VPNVRRLGETAEIALRRLAEGDESALADYLTARDAVLGDLRAGSSRDGAEIVVALDRKILEAVDVERERLRAAIRNIVAARQALNAYRGETSDPHLVERLG